MNIRHKNIVIGTTDTHAEFKVPVGGAPTDFQNIKFADKAITYTWYVPIDNLSQLTRFDHIEVKPDRANVGAVTLRLRANTAATSVRIVIYGMTD